MQYKVIPFVANVANQQGSIVASSQLEELVNQMASEGWEYMRLESVDTYIEGNNGCFGIGAVQGRMTSFSMLVFRQ